ncbi:MAG: hypothetical protein UW70_C0057G0008, partial [Candidatus Peregrinibacteria bacterium GW2011_GWA2_44_7]
VLKRGWKWQDQLPFTTGKETKEILACSQCRRNYKLIAQEVAWAKKRRFPLPHLCPECRYEQRMRVRNPRKLHDRPCAQCGEAFQTTTPTDSPKSVYCEPCYLKVIY